MSIRTKSKLLALLALCSVSLSACAFAPIPKEERYVNIDKTLELIDYKTVGPIIEEKIDNGDGVLSPSYKEILYNGKAYDVLHPRIKSFEDDCTGSKKDGNLSCFYSHTSIAVRYYQNEDQTIMRLTDSSSGRNLQ